LSPGAKVVRKIADLANKAAGAGYRSVAVVGVEAGCLIADGVHDDEAGGDDVGSVDDPSGCVSEQGAAQTMAVEIAVQGEPGDEHGRDAVWRSSSNPTGKVLAALDDVAGQGEVGDDQAILRPHPGAPGANRFGVERGSAEPLIEAGLAGVE